MLPENNQGNPTDLLDYLDAIFPPGAKGTLIYSVHTEHSHTENPVPWPAIRATVADTLARESAHSDIYVCPYLMSGRKRSKGKALERRVIHTDVDNTQLDTETIRQIGGFAVASGTPGHAHVYVPLARSVSASQHEALCKALCVMFDGDTAKHNDNDLLRPPGTLNHKPGGQPVTWLVHFDGHRVDPDELAEKLGAYVDPKAARETGTVVDLTRYRGVAKALAHVSDPADRSDDTMRIVGACYDANLTLEQARWVVNQRDDLRGRLDARNDDDVLGCWLKIDNKRRTGGIRAETISDTTKAEDAGKASQAETRSTSIDSTRILRLVPASEIISDIPDWVWSTEGEGRIQRSVLTLFAGRPGAGKSTAARWFAAQWSRGLLGGCWQGKPQKVAYIASEEALEYVVKPGLQMAGANMDNIVFPEVKMNGEALALMSDIDEYELTKQFIAQGVTTIFVDPIMATIRKKVDIYRNNELREVLQPWVRIAQRINGTVIGVVHLVKGTSGDVVSSINGSAAFGEVARCVFGFAVNPDDKSERVMSQHKNSCGPDNLALTYEIDVRSFQADSGRVGDMPVFHITGESDITVSDILSAPNGRGSRALSDKAQKVLDLVNSRDETSAAIVVDAGLANTTNTASKMLERLYKRDLIDNPIYGSYCPKYSP